MGSSGTGADLGRGEGALLAHRLFLLLGPGVSKIRKKEHFLEGLESTHRRMAARGAGALAGQLEWVSTRVWGGGCPESDSALGRA